MVNQDYRRTFYGIAEAIAPGWERRRAFIEELTTPLRDWLVRELAPQPGDTLLELAAGAGDTGYQAAALIGDQGRLISTDFSPAMLDVARRRGAERGVRNVEYRVMDAEKIDLEDNSVDGVLCRFGFMLMADPAAALAETRRVLREGKKLALAVWGPPERNPFFVTLAQMLVERGHIPPPDPSGPGIFSMASEQRTRGLLEQAGFGQTRTEYVTVRITFADIDEYFAIAKDTAGPIAMALRALPDSECQTIKQRLQGAFAGFAAGGRYQVPGVALAAVAS